MTLLQNVALGRTLGPVKGSSGDKISPIAAVESIEVFAVAATGRFLARTICNPLRAGIARVERALEEVGSRLLGGSYWQGKINVLNLGPRTTSTSAVWEAIIAEMANRDMGVYPHESRDQECRVGGR